MKYPAIIRNDNEIEMLLLNEDSAIILSEAHKGQLHDVFPRFRRRYVDITHEYLSNTWGVVESKEHAEFIIELAELHGFELLKNGFSNKNYFHIGGKSFMLLINEPRFKGGYKQITIPLPPKVKVWPQVGDDALMMSGKCKIAALADKHGNLAVTNEFGFNLIVNKSEIKKPKSKQDLLIEELQTKLCNNNAVDNYILACDIINGEIEGLSYESKLALA